ncbi:MAG: hypothetical protein GY931_04440, partial [Maribacter sp.]|nr:hypothetical protein [Maribacter sp.]
ILRESISPRGGGVEISLDNFGYPGEKMTAYQNYLGGGMLGSIGNDCTIESWRLDKKLLKISDQLARYYHEQTRHDWDEWEDASFEQNQLRPSSAY